MEIDVTEDEIEYGNTLLGNFVQYFSIAWLTNFPPS